LLSIGEYILNKNFGMDDFFFKEISSSTGLSIHTRIPLITAVNFFLIGIIFFIKMIKPSNYKIIQTLSIGVFFTSLFAFCEYIYAEEGYYGVSSFTKIAIQSSFAFIVLTIGLIASQGERGIVIIFSNDTIGGAISRKLLPMIIILPLFLDWLELLGERH
jgi:uncharacterized membrane protein